MPNKHIPAFLKDTLLPNLEKHIDRLSELTSQGRLAQEEEASGEPCIDFSELPSLLSPRCLPLLKLFHRSINELQESALFNTPLLADNFKIHRTIFHQLLILLDEEEAQSGLEPGTLTAKLRTKLNTWYLNINQTIAFCQRESEPQLLDMQDPHPKSLEQARYHYAREQQARVKMALWGNEYALAALQKFEQLVYQYKEKKYSDISEEDQQQLVTLYKKFQDLCLRLDPQLDESLTKLFNGLSRRGGQQHVYDKQGYGESIAHFLRKHWGLAELNELLDHSTQLRLIIISDNHHLDNRQAFFEKLITSDIAHSAYAPNCQLVKDPINVDTIHTLEQCEFIFLTHDLTEEEEQALHHRASEIQDELLDQVELQRGVPKKHHLAMAKLSEIALALPALREKQTALFDAVHPRIKSKLKLDAHNIVSLYPSISDEYNEIDVIAYHEAFSALASYFYAIERISSLPDSGADSESQKNRLSNALYAYDQAKQHQQALAQRLGPSRTGIQKLFEPLFVEMQALFLKYCPEDLPEHIGEQPIAVKASYEEAEISFIQAYLPGVPETMLRLVLSPYSSREDKEHLLQLQTFETLLQDFDADAELDKAKLKLDELCSLAYTLMVWFSTVEHENFLETGLLTKPLYQSLINKVTQAIENKHSLSFTNTLNSTYVFQQQLALALGRQATAKESKYALPIKAYEERIEKLDKLLNAISKINAYWFRSDTALSRFKNRCYRTSEKSYRADKVTLHECFDKALPLLLASDPSLTDFTIDEHPDEDNLRPLLIAANQLKWKTEQIKKTLEINQAQATDRVEMYASQGQQQLVRYNVSLNEYAHEQFELRKEHLLRQPVTLFDLDLRDAFFAELNKYIDNEKLSFIDKAKDEDIDESLTESLNAHYIAFMKTRYVKYRMLDKIKASLNEFNSYLEQAPLWLEPQQAKEDKQSAVTALDKIISNKHLRLDYRIEKAKETVLSAEFQQTIRKKPQHKVLTLDWCRAWLDKLIAIFTGDKKQALANNMSAYAQEKITFFTAPSKPMIPQDTAHLPWISVSA